MFLYLLTSPDDLGLVPIPQHISKCSTPNHTSSNLQIKKSSSVPFSCLCFFATLGYWCRSDTINLRRRMNVVGPFHLSICIFQFCYYHLQLARGPWSAEKYLQFKKQNSIMVIGRFTFNQQKINGCWLLSTHYYWWKN